MFYFYKWTNKNYDLTHIFNIFIHERLKRRWRKLDGKNTAFRAVGRLNGHWEHLTCYRREKYKDCFLSFHLSIWGDMRGLCWVKFHHKLLMMSLLRWKMDTRTTRKGRMNADFNDSFLSSTESGWNLIFHHILLCINMEVFLWKREGIFPLFLFYPCSSAPSV